MGGEAESAEGGLCKVIYLYVVQYAYDSASKQQSTTFNLLQQLPRRPLPAPVPHPRAPRLLADSALFAHLPDCSRAVTVVINFVSEDSL